MAARLLASLFAVCLASAADASVLWSTAASGCVPVDATIKFDRHSVGNASVQHAPDDTGPIVLICPIAPFSPTGGDWTLRLTYRDSTGAAAAAFVRARAYRMSHGSGTPVLLGTASSDSSASTVRNTVESPEIPHTVNFEASVYWVRVELVRATAAQTVVFHSVALDIPLGSDIRLKHNVALLGHLANGLGFYRFSYIGSDAAYVGVMAQEVEAVMPDAVVRGSDGYLRVFYDRLGLRMQTFDDWVAAGEKIPATVPPTRQ
jgi:hypothetical protein